MPKRVVKKENNDSTKTYSEKKVEKILIENFVSLQKVMVNLSEKFDGLTKQLSKLLELFEVSAKTLAEKELDIEKSEGNKKMMEKLDGLLDQNKLIARGLTLIHDRISEEPEYEEEIPQKQPLPTAPKIEPQIPMKKLMPSKLPSQNEMPGYQRSNYPLGQEVPPIPSPEQKKMMPPK